MTKQKSEPEREWMVPMKCVGLGLVFVTAKTTQEALEKVQAGDWDREELIETFDWEVDSNPQLNE